MNKRLLSGLVLATVATLGFTAPVNAEPRTARVSLAGIDLTDPAGVAHLHRKVSRAVREVCGPEHGNLDIIRAMATRRCQKEAMNSARRQMVTAIALAEARKNNRFAAITVPASDLR